MPSVERYKSGKGAHATPYVNTVNLTRLENFCFSTCLLLIFSILSLKLKFKDQLCIKNTTNSLSGVKNMVSIYIQQYALKNKQALKSIYRL